MIIEDSRRRMKNDTESKMTETDTGWQGSGGQLAMSQRLPLLEGGVWQVPGDSSPREQEKKQCYLMASSHFQASVCQSKTDDHPTRPTRNTQLVPSELRDPPARTLEPPAPESRPVKYQWLGPAEIYLASSQLINFLPTHVTSPVGETAFGLLPKQRYKPKVPRRVSG